MEKKNGLAIAALVLAIISTVTFWVPIVNFAVMFIALIGLILGLCALGHPKKTMAIVAAAMCFVAIVGAILVNHFTAKAVVGAVDYAVDHALEEVTSETEYVQLQSEIEEVIDAYVLDTEVDSLEQKDDCLLFSVEEPEPITILESEDYIYKILGYRISEDEFTGEKIISIRYSFQNFTHEGKRYTEVIFADAYQGQYGLAWTIAFDGPVAKDVRDGGITEYEESYVLENEEDDVEYIIRVYKSPSEMEEKTLRFEVK